MSDPVLVRVRRATRPGRPGELSRRRSAAPASAALLDAIERIGVLAAFALFYAANAGAHRPLNLLVVATDGLTVLFILVRRPARAVSRSPADWIIAALGTLCTLFMRPGGESLLAPAVAGGLVAAAALLNIAAKFSLNLSFGIAPANRGVQTGGVYAFVRHPMYLGYLILTAVFALMNPTGFNLALMAVGVAAQFERIRREERFLLTDPDYRRYAQQVRFRLLPGLY
ncbi:methyltransferase family protein [Phenylobacterium soli]|uniref:Isoprenylcysteine carboxylmethyltransferase family protein n=1 Tax=Phenylobacterium soli TaxID=2170551 RepID=A0A328ARG5_9CAUL|nr:isoprenylcysteine carboxylmethyltransferase family protein [Phenylobacterium soli]RAK56124.1 isoprenylcysteine carboxylmethyltransferase family protein [Phenylobacterium soli]